MRRTNERIYSNIPNIYGKYPPKTPIFALNADHIFVFMVLCGPNFSSPRCVREKLCSTCPSPFENKQRQQRSTAFSRACGQRRPSSNTIVRYTLDDNILTKPIPVAHKLLCFACVWTSWGVNRLVWAESDAAMSVCYRCVRVYCVRGGELMPNEILKVLYHFFSISILAAKARDSCFDLGFYSHTKKIALTSNNWQMISEKRKCHAKYIQH